MSSGRDTFLYDQKVIKFVRLVAPVVLESKMYTLQEALDFQAWARVNQPKMFDAGLSEKQAIVAIAWHWENCPRLNTTAVPDISVYDVISGIAIAANLENNKNA
jgi:hypothetical protein